MQVPKILIVGCGITGGSVYHFLTKLFNYPKECFTFWEDSKYIGGRMRKIRFQNSQCDVGAQYITKFSNNFDDVYSVLTSNRILVPFTSYIEGAKDDHFSKSHFVSARGLSSIVEYFLQDLSNENQIQYQTRLQELDVVDTGGFVVTSLSRNELKQQFFDIVIITIPKSSVYEIKGNFRNFVNPIFFDQLDSIRYSSR
jgi:predicted NAD/FAD-dependent oxidoreductase